MHGKVTAGRNPAQAAASRAEVRFLGGSEASSPLLDQIQTAKGARRPKLARQRDGI